MVSYFSTFFAKYDHKFQVFVLSWVVLDFVDISSVTQEKQAKLYKFTYTKLSMFKGQGNHILDIWPFQSVNKYQKVYHTNNIRFFTRSGRDLCVILYFYSNARKGRKWKIDKCSKLIGENCIILKIFCKGKPDVNGYSYIGRKNNE